MKLVDALKNKKGEYFRGLTDGMFAIFEKHPRLKKKIKILTVTSVILGITWLFAGRRIVFEIESLLGIQTIENEDEEKDNEEVKSCELVINPYDENKGLYVDCKEQYDKEKLCRSVVNPYKKFDNTEFTITKSDLNEKLFNLEFDKNNLSFRDLEDKLKNLLNN